VWGVATSAYQVEGAVREDGRGLSIWDTFSHTSGRIRGGDTGDVACDQYHRLEEDVALMSDIGVGAYRFSLAWPRIQPEGRGPANQRGLDYYSGLIDALHRRGIVPFPTLYHWDLPQPLEDAGGWPERDTAARFADYAAVVAEYLAGTVGAWTTINEPWVAAWMGYGLGVHAPGRTDDRDAVAASHHLLLAHGMAAEILRAAGAAEVGIALNLYPVRPASSDPDDVRAASLMDEQMNRMYLDALYGRGYPPASLERYGTVMDLGFIQSGDLETIAAPLDFLGVNYYTTQTVTLHPAPHHRSVIELPGLPGAWSVVEPGVEVTSMGWAIEPSGMTELLVGLARDYGMRKVFVTENGAAFDDQPGPGGSVSDTNRIDYLRAHLLAARDAIGAGVPLAGYFVWSLMDNFEWAEGYGKRFGLVYVDYPTQARTPKESASWYGGVARGGLLA
jgi:beta-glucosidase